MMMPGFVIILLIAVLLPSMSYLGDAQSKCDNAECFCGPCQATIRYLTRNGECIKICTCNCLSPPSPFQTNPPSLFQTNPLQAPPPATKSNPQPLQPPTVTIPNPSIKAPQAPPKTTVVTPIVSTPKPSTALRHQPNPLDPLSNCEVPILAPYPVERGRHCWCTMKSHYKGCFERISMAATTNYAFMEVDKNCCDAFWVAYKTCGIIDQRYRYFLYRLKQHCSMFY
ncbi:hypothetical protein HRI_005204200 [Hibiscus trionum]|uniref:Prolamin-like domain-containing protein n=1 Tax=Hibiscus trionum TaxID=183268 RepID=A0A9W7JIY6_HIBTR|nr:hypothetical protein HRI_005204200 [Hibiscus trionum]